MYTEDEKSGLNEFLTAIYGETSGVAYTATKKIVDKKVNFEQDFFDWPVQANAMVENILAKRSTGDVYYAPALFNSARATKDNVKGASVVWVELDKTPRNISTLPQPDIKVQSSIEGKEHWYWKLDSFASVAEIEKINKSLTYLLGADISGWDASQILRPPNTINFKYSSPLPVSILALGRGYASLDSFAWLPAPPEPPQPVLIRPEKVPEIEEIIFRHTLPDSAIKMFREGPDDKLRGKSDGLMQLGYDLAQSGFSNEESLAMLMHADSRWGKFHLRDDFMKHFLKIISVAKNKYPEINNFQLPSVKLMSFMDIVEMTRSIEWLVEGLLEANGNAMISSAPGVGKTQFSLQIAAHIALGKPFLDFKVEKPTKIVFFSLEMDDLALKVFMQKQAKSYSKAEQELLRENFIVYPLGQPMSLNHADKQNEALDILTQGDFQGAFFDSLSRATDASLVDDIAMRALMGWVDGIRSTYKKFTWWIHHNRKPNGDNKKPKLLGDLYGSVYVTSPLSTAMVLWPTGAKHEIELSFVKSRLAENHEPFIITRDTDTLTFSRRAGITIVDKMTLPVDGVSRLNSPKLRPIV